MADAAAGTAWTPPFVPATASLRRLELAARSCQGGPLYRDAEQVVFGEGGLKLADELSRSG